MSILTKIEAKSTKGRLFQAGVFVALVIGGITMVYPFLLMLSGAMRSDMDISEMDLVPDYMTNNKILIRKFLESKYHYDPVAMNCMRETRDYSFKDAMVPEKINEKEIKDFENFLSEYDMPDHWQVLGGTFLFKKIPSNVYNELLENIRERYNDDITELNKDLGSPLRIWKDFSLKFPEWTNSRFDYKPSPLYEEYFKLIEKRPLADRSFVSLTGAYLENMVYPEYGISSVKTYNQKHKKLIKSYEELVASRTAPPANRPESRKEWKNFVLDCCNLSFVRVKASDREFQTFLKKKYGNNIKRLNKYWSDSGYKSFSQIKLPGEKEWVPASMKADYTEFLKSRKLEDLYLVGPEFAWQDYLRNKYGTLGAMNKAYGTDYSDWALCRIPVKQIERQYVESNTGTLRWRYAIKNFVIVFDEIFIQGRSFVNTVIYVCLALIFSLTIQPLVAYSLSKFNPPGTWKFILIFMATMAFPPMVAFIPQFLIIKKLHLLNTFIALVLPVTINGYLIFLLKGYFDSIPKDLYDAAMIDGASEMRMFWQITMSLSKPILAVVALNTFRMAWMSFMYPLIVCPEEKMYVLAVWLYQFQAQATTSAVFASILVTSIPTLLLFIVTQRTIMRGIAVPSEK